MLKLFKWNEKKPRKNKNKTLKWVLTAEMIVDRPLVHLCQLKANLHVSHVGIGVACGLNQSKERSKRYHSVLKILSAANMKQRLSKAV